MTDLFDDLDESRRRLADEVKSLEPEDESLEYIKDNFDDYAREMSQMTDEIDGLYDVLEATNEFIGDAADNISRTDEAYDFFLYIDEGGDLDASDLESNILEGVEREGRKTRNTVTEEHNSTRSVLEREAQNTRDTVRTQHDDTRSTVVDEVKGNRRWFLGGFAALILGGLGYDALTSEESSDYNGGGRPDGGGPVDSSEPDYVFDERYDGEEFVECFNDDELDRIEELFGEDPEDIEYEPTSGDGDTINVKIYADGEDGTYSTESLDCEVGR